MLVRLAQLLNAWEPISLMLAPNTTLVTSGLPIKALFATLVTGRPRYVSGMTISPLALPTPVTSNSVLLLVRLKTIPVSWSRTKEIFADQAEAEASTFAAGSAFTVMV